MAQLSLYLDDETMDRLRQRARERRVSLSKYVSDLVKRDLGRGWPPGFFGLYGSIDDETFEVPDEIPWEFDAPRPWDDPDWRGLSEDAEDGRESTEEGDGGDEGAPDRREGEGGA